MPPRRSFRGRPPPRPVARDRRAGGRVAFVRRTVPMPEGPLVLRVLGAGDADGADERWELICRDGWEWQRSGRDQVLVRVATLTPEQAVVVQEWIERIKDPAVWWAVSRELNAPDSSPEVARALAVAPWLAQVLPVLLEASSEGAPPPPPDA